MRELYTACPHCQKKLRRGLRRFGPAVVTCGYCEGTVRTGLADWDRMSPGRKVWNVVLEVIFPSFFKGMDWPAKQLMYFCTMLLALVPIHLLPIFLLVALLPGKPADSNPLDGLIAVAIIGIYDLLMAFRVRRMIAENQRFNASQTPPVWRWLS